ncbi:MAG: UvrD-helicase domain-containing protein [Eubacterium sp.]|nr:UvrD-helicase domain-containing protein [Eubacterium sp.]
MSDKTFKADVTLNDMQELAVYHTDGPLLILAGAGSGKTRVLTHRVAYLIKEKGVEPYQIMAITFTNKAADEMRERIDKLVGFGADQVWVSTFHSACVKILRRFADQVGYKNDFTIYDADDQKKVMRDIIKMMNLDTKLFKEKGVVAKISDFKNKLMTVSDVRDIATHDFKERTISQIYEEYQRILKKSNAMDFDDLIMKTVELFQKHPEVLEMYQERLKYIMVDEYQDTNMAQFKFVQLLASKYQNICVVGDDDQSIYKFRGADIGNILSFENHFENARVVKLEQNYRSTKNILDAANAVIKNNEGRKDKTLWCDEDRGDKIEVYQAEDGFAEAEMVADTIKEEVDNGRADYNDYAILYRTNAQSRALEEKLMMKNIPYKIIGGQNFYQRREIKDILAYLRIIANPTDDLSVERVINVPKRGIGQTTVDKVKAYAREHDINLYEAFLKASEVPGINAGTATKIKSFTDMIEELSNMLGPSSELPVEGEELPSSPYSIKDVVDKLIELTGYVAELVAEETDEADGRIENIDELVSKVAEYEENAEQPNLGEFLEEVSLVSDIDTLDENSSYVVMMTVHSAKGLEYPHIFLCGMEDGLFPSYMTIMSEDDEELEEERRLAYVAITRAMKKLTISYAKRRMIRGETQYNMISRFVKEIPSKIVNSKNVTDTMAHGMRKKNSFSNFGGYEGSLGHGGGYQGRRDDSSNSDAVKAFKKKPSYGKPKSKPSFGKEFSVEKSEVDYKVGDRVVHQKFGEGTVKEIEDGPRDYQVTVDFDEFGEKIMMASFAKLEKI